MNTIRFGTLALAGGFGGWISNEATQSFLLSVCAMVALVTYRLLRKFKKEKPKGFMDFMGVYMVELALIAVLLPHMVNTLIDAGVLMVK